MAEHSDEMRTLIQEIAKVLVDAPDQVSVEAVDDAEGTVLELRVAESDLGKVIGKQGRTARSLRTILSAASMKFHERYSLEIIE
ncbi:MAG TPA: KH domain-containing protein [Terriglobales bacterium]|nr:KH domain-containing protein [Terriglobales bacterium]